MFRRAKALAGSSGTLTVAVQDDVSVVKYKPQAKLVYDWNTRAGMIRSLRYVDYVVAYSDVDKAVKEISFDVLVLGGDQVHQGFQRAVKWCKENGKKVVRLSRTDGISSSQLRNDCLSI